MSTRVRQLGISGGAGINSWNNLALNTSDGRLILVVPDHNDATLEAPWGDQSGTRKVYVYESTDRVNFTLRTTITVVNLSDTYNVFAAIAPNNKIGIATVQDNGAVRYYEVSTAWAVTVDEVALAADATWSYRFVQLSFTDGNIPVLACQLNDSNDALKHAAWVRAGGVWTESFNVQKHANGADRAYEGFSFTVLKGGTASARNVAYALGTGRGSDGGVELYTATVNETTGASSGPTKQTTYNQGDVGKTKYQRARIVKVSPTGTNEYTYASIQWFPKGKMTVARSTFDGTTYTETVKPSTTNYFHSRSTMRDVAISYGERNGVEAVNFYFLRRDEERDRLVNITRRIQSDGFVTDRVRSVFDEWSTLGAVAGMTAGPGYHTDGASHDVILFRSNLNGNRWTAEHVYAAPPKAPASVGPAGVVNTSTPLLKAEADLDREWSQSQIKMQWRVSRTVDFTTDLREFVMPDSAYRLVNNTHRANTIESFSYKVPEAESLAGGDWYLQAAHVDEYGNDPIWTAAVLADIVHPPTAAQLSPDFSGRQTFGNGVKQFSWKFTDPYAKDVQSAYQVVIINAYTGATLFDSGKVISSTPGATVNIDPAWKNLRMSWTVRLWDAADDVGAYAPQAAMTYADGPTVTISHPAAGVDVTTSMPKVTFTATSSVGGAIKKVRATWRKGSEVVYTTGIRAVNRTSGSEITLSNNSALLRNEETYTVDVYVEDEFGLNKTTSRSFNTQWPKPAMPPPVTVDASVYNSDAGGYVRLTWDDSTQDPSFIGWYVERKADEIDSNTGTVIWTGEWELVAILYQDDDTFTFDDYTAPSNSKTMYRVIQAVSTYGDTVTSDPRETATVTLKGGGYWLVEEFNELEETLAMKLTSVSDDSYTDEYEEAEIHLLGRGHRVERGDYLGVRGSLTAKLRDGGGMTARYKRQKLMLIKESGTRLYLRNPFGDTYPVSVGNLQISRIAGVGEAEFVDVTIPYVEVYGQ